MNDYTKNISSPIFTPGIYRQTQNLTLQSDKYMNTEYRTKNLKITPKRIEKAPISNDFESVQ